MSDEQEVQPEAPVAEGDTVSTVVVEETAPAAPEAPVEPEAQV